MADNDKGERSRKAYRKGAEDSKRGSGWDHFFHETDDFLKSVLPIPDFRSPSQKGEDKAYEAGWHDYEDKKYRYKKGLKRGRSSSPTSASSSSSSSDTSAGGCVVPLILAVVVMGGVYMLGKAGLERYKETKEWEKKRTQQVWTMMGVNTTKLNVRSGPGTDSPVIAKFERGSRLAITGSPVSNGSEQWIRVSTDDGKIQGWANYKYLSTSPQMQEQEPQANEETTTAAQPAPSEQPTPAKKKVVYPDLGPMQPPPPPTASTDFGDVKNPKPLRRECQAQVDSGRVSSRCEWYKKEIEALAK